MHFILPYFIIILIVIQLYLKKVHVLAQNAQKILGKGTESQFNTKAGYKHP